MKQEGRPTRMPKHRPGIEGDYVTIRNWMDRHPVNYPDHMYNLFEIKNEHFEHGCRCQTADDEEDVYFEWAVRRQPPLDDGGPYWKNWHNFREEDYYLLANPMEVVF
jgi:hypothetical protein